MDLSKTGVIFLILLAISYCFAEDYAHEVVRGEKKLEELYYLNNFETFYGFWPLQNTTIDTKTSVIDSERDEKVEEIFADEIPTISYLPIEVSETFPNLKKYTISKCRVQEIGAENLKNLKSIRLLDLKENEISSIDKDAFKDLVALEILYLQQNRIRSLHEQVLSNNRKLKEIEMHDNQLESLPSNLLQNLVELKDVKLSGNQLKTLDSTVFANNLKLGYVNLEGNQIEHLHADTFEGLSELYFVVLNGNKCIDRAYDYDPDGLPKLSSDLAQNCSQTLS